MKDEMPRFLPSKSDITIQKREKHFYLRLLHIKVFLSLKKKVLLYKIKHLHNMFGAIFSLIIITAIFSKG